jgi:virulence-associated protein VapD
MVTGKRVFQMAQYAIAFDLDTRRMRNDGLSDSDRTSIYQREIPEALASCGFTAHPQGSLYHTEAEHDPITAIMNLKEALKTDAPCFCMYVKRVHVFRMEEWSDVTPMFSGYEADSTPSATEELEESDDLGLLTG